MRNAYTYVRKVGIDVCLWAGWSPDQLRIKTSMRDCFAHLHHDPRNWGGVVWKWSLVCSFSKSNLLVDLVFSLWGTELEVAIRKIWTVKGFCALSQKKKKKKKKKKQQQRWAGLFHMWGSSDWGTSLNTPTPLFITAFPPSDQCSRAHC